MSCLVIKASDSNSSMPEDRTPPSSPIRHVVDGRQHHNRHYRFDEGRRGIQQPSYPFYGGGPRRAGQDQRRAGHDYRLHDGRPRDDYQLQDGARRVHQQNQPPRPAVLSKKAVVAVGRRLLQRFLPGGTPVTQQVVGQALFAAKAEGVPTTQLKYVIVGLASVHCELGLLELAANHKGFVSQGHMEYLLVKASYEKTKELNRALLRRIGMRPTIDNWGTILRTMLEGGNWRSVPVDVPTNLQGFRNGKFKYQDFKLDVIRK